MQTARTRIVPADPKEIEAALNALLSTGVRIVTLQSHMVPIMQGGGHVVSVDSNGRPGVVPGVLLIAIVEPVEKILASPSRRGAS